jgi:sugar phosphate isomerase/epimerase
VARALFGSRPCIFTFGVVITPSGFSNAKLSPGNLITVDFDMKLVDGAFRPTVETAMHTYIHAHRSELSTVIHTHSPIACDLRWCGVGSATFRAWGWNIGALILVPREENITKRSNRAGIMGAVASMIHDDASIKEAPRLLKRRCCCLDVTLRHGREQVPKPNYLHAVSIRFMSSLWKISAPVWAFFERQTRFFRIGKRVPIEDIMKGLNELGFDGIEMGVFNPTEDGSATEINKVAGLLRSFKLECPQVYIDIAGKWPLAAFTHPDSNVRHEVVEHFRAGVEIAKALGVKMVGISPDCDGFPHPFGVHYRDAWNWFKECMGLCADAAKDASIKFAFEYKPKETRNFSLIANADTVLRLIDQVKANNMGVLLDTGHAMYAKEDLPTTVEKLDRALFHVHVDDNYGDWDDDLVPGTVHDFTDFFRALTLIDYRGYVGLDIYPMQDPFGECRRSKKYIDVICGRLKPS